LGEGQFLDLIGATNLIPGPNSTEMAIHIDYLRAGWPGLIVGGMCFILPAMLIVMGLSWAYVQYGTTPQASWLMYGIQPVVVAIIAKALWDLGRKAIRSALTAVVGLAVFGLYFLKVNEIVLLFGGALLVMAVENWRRQRKAGNLALFAPLAAFSLVTAAATPFSLPLLFLTFFKIGAVLYGSGYVLLAFVHADFVEKLGWLTEKQLVDAIAIGQVTPGPVFTTATFIGYIMGGPLAAVVATVGIFLPAFILVALTNPWVPHLRNSPWASSLLDGVNAAALGLMAGVTVQIGRSALIDLATVLLALVTFILIFRFRVNSTWLILGGAGLGLLYGFLR